MTDYLSVEQKHYFYLLGIEYFFDELYEEDFVDNIEKIIDRYLPKDNDQLRLKHIYKTKGWREFLISLGELLAYLSHSIYFEKTEPYDKKQFFFEREENETTQQYIERLISCAQFDSSCKPLGKIVINKQDFWFSVNAFDNVQSVVDNLDKLKQEILCGS